MTTVTIYQDDDLKYYGFEANGHAGFKKAGRDIVCASISVLLLNIINSVEELTDAHMIYEAEEKSGYLKFEVKDYDDDKIQILFLSLMIGLRGIEESYPKFLKLTNRRCKP